jgi:hypothetical protein
VTGEAHVVVQTGVAERFSRLTRPATRKSPTKRAPWLEVR